MIIQTVQNDLHPLQWDISLKFNSIEAGPTVRLSARQKHDYFHVSNDAMLAPSNVFNRVFNLTVGPSLIEVKSEDISHEIHFEHSCQFHSVSTGIGQKVLGLALGGMEWPLKVSSPNSSLFRSF